MPKNGCFFWAGWLLFCALANASSAATNPPARTASAYTIDKWDTDTEDGLPNNEVITITQTRDGFLWLGTLNGLVRFDGHHFTIFDESNTPGLNSGRIVKLFEDSQTNLWIATQNAGVAFMKNGTITTVPETVSGGPERRLVGIAEDSKGAVWLYLANGELWRVVQGKYTLFTNFVVESRRRALTAEAQGPVWVGTEYRLHAIDPATTGAALELPDTPESHVGKLDFLLASKGGGYWRLADGHIEKRTNNLGSILSRYYPWSLLVPIAAACEDGHGNLLVGTLGLGLFWFDPEGNFTNISTNEGLSNNHILSLHVDREGTLWVGTDGGGLCRVKRRVFDVLPESAGLLVPSVCEDRTGGLWLGANKQVIQSKDGAIRRFPPFLRAVWSLLAGNHGELWAGTIEGGLFEFKDGSFQRLAGPDALMQDIIAMHEDEAGVRWLGTRAGLVRWDGKDWRVFTTSDGLSSDTVRALAADKEGNLWIGTGGGGLNFLQAGKFTTYHKKDGVPSEDISSLYLDEQGVLWIGTDGSGLGRYEKGKWTRYTTSEGLISNSIGYLLEDAFGFLWIGSNRGLMRAPKKALNEFANSKTNSVPFRAYRMPDGLPTSECSVGSQPGACRTRDGKLWFPTISGLAFIDPAQLRPNTNPPPVVIESVLIEGQAQNTNALRVGWPQAIVVPAGKERLEIHYTSLNLAAPGRARFRYRLDEHETAWTEVGSNVRVANYTRLESGHYWFRVKACNEDEVWNEAGSSVELIVKPPLWKTWWFLTALGTSLLGIISGGVYYVSTQKLQRQLERLRQQEALEKERARIARDIHDQLGASLTQVSLLGEFVESDKDSPSEVEAHARQICQTARDTTRVLDEIVWTVNPSNDTLEGLVNYICKYAQDYLAVAGLRYRLDVPSQLPNASIPPELRHNVFLAAKEAITNIVRHAKASSAWVRLKLEPEAFVLEIQDDGRGLAGLDPKAAQARNGLRNMRKRMEDVGGTFSMTPAADQGTIVRLKAPLPKSSQA